MIAVLQRTDGVQCLVDSQEVGALKGPTLLVLLGIKNDDKDEDLEYIIKKIPELRIFEDENGKMNKSALDIQAGLFVVSQFTLFARCRKGRRPNFMDAASYQLGKNYYDQCVEELKKTGLRVETGVYGEEMDLRFNNKGPVTILLDSREE
ncbi:MAG: D-aminoacyl-tRNA deacylase [Tissierellia bacterium]|nr:D-aminoacyl-tRNA deacylase [Tissierellia bacterium]